MLNSIPSYGAAPLSKLFCLTRVLQVVAMLVIIGITSNFIDLIVSTGVEPPQEFVGTISVTCIATLYIAVSVAFFWSGANLGLFVMTGIDSLLLIAFIVVAVTMGKPISYLNCYMVGKAAQSNGGNDAFTFVQSVSQNLNTSGSKLDLRHWAGTTKANCFQAKTIWGLSIALCILFTVSCTLLPALFYKNKKANAPPKSVEA